MSQDFRSQTQTTVASGQAVDAGLQKYMQSVLNAMAVGLSITGLSAFTVANIPALYSAIFGTPLFWVAMFAPMVFLWAGFTPRRIAAMSPQKMRTTFYIFAAMMGISFASIFVIFTGASIARTFFISAAAFAATALYGYTTKKDLTGMASFLFMGAVGVGLAILLNMFMQSSMVHFVVSVIGVFVFTGLTAFEVQRLKETYSYGRGMEAANAKLATLGALNLYMSFINIFQFMLAFTGNQRN